MQTGDVGDQGRGEPPAPAIIKPVVSPENGHAPAIRVLYVDDEKALLEVGKAFLERKGEFSVTTAISAAVAMELLSRENFDAVVSDYSMPVTDGIRFLQDVRARFGRIPFILFTGRGREEVVIEAINSGVDFYLQKGGEPRSQFAELTLKILQAVQRRKAEVLLLQREEGYRHLIENSAEAIGVIQDGIILRVNPPIERLTGYTEKELVSSPFLSFVHPEDRDMMAERYAKRMGGGEALSQYPARLVRKDGRTIWLEISAVVITWNGRPASINFLVDSTARIEAEQALAREKDYLDQILNTISDPLFVKDTDHRRILVNDAYCSFVGRQRDQLIGKADPELYPAAVADALLHDDDLVLATATEQVREEVIPFRDGSRRVIVTKKNLLTDHHGQKFIVGIARDISALKQAETNLTRMQENYEAFLNSIDEFMYVLDQETERILYVNGPLLSRLGFLKEDLYGRSVLTLYPVERKEEAARAVREMMTGSPQSFQIPLSARDASIVQAETRASRGRWDGKSALFCVSRELSER